MKGHPRWDNHAPTTIGCGGCWRLPEDCTDEELLVTEHPTQSDLIVALLEELGAMTLIDALAVALTKTKATWAALRNKESHGSGRGS
jgi:hypothetical protein